MNEQQVMIGKVRSKKPMLACLQMLSERLKALVQELTLHACLTLK